jgi:hypothetical protein
VLTDLAGEDYARAVSADRGRCFRWIHDFQGQPTRCPAPITRNGWFYLSYERKWYLVDSCEGHVSQLEARPHPGHSGP